MRDSQRNKCYTWEDSQPWMNKKGGELTYEQAEYIITKLNPKRYLVKGREGTTAYCHNKYISLPSWALTWGVVLHELAHSFTPDWHGPKFMSCYAYLIHKFHPMHPPILELADSMRKANLNFAYIQDWKKKFGRIKLSIETVEKQVKPLPWERTTEITIVKLPKRKSNVSKMIERIITCSLFNNRKYIQVDGLISQYNKSIKGHRKLTVSDIRYFIERGFFKSREVNAFSRNSQFAKHNRKVRYF